MKLPLIHKPLLRRLARLRQRFERRTYWVTVRWENGNQRIKTVGVIASNQVEAIKIARCMFPADVWHSDCFRGMELTPQVAVKEQD